MKTVWPFLYSLARKKKYTVETMLSNYANRQLEIFAVNSDSLLAFHSSGELHDFMEKMDLIRLQEGTDRVDWFLTSHKQFSVKSCYDFLNDGGLRSRFQSDIWKVAVPLKIKIFVWLATHDKTLFRENLGKRGWGGLQNCEIYGYDIESNCHIFLHCPFAVNIWAFFLSDSASILDCHISDVFFYFNPQDLVFLDNIGVYLLFQFYGLYG